MTMPIAVKRRRQIIYWRLLNQLFAGEKSRNLDEIAGEILAEMKMPQMLLDPKVSIDTLLQRYPELNADLDTFQKKPESTANGGEPKDLRQPAVYAKMLLNIFASIGSDVSAQQYSDWCADVAKLEIAFGYAPGQMRAKGHTLEAEDQELAKELQYMEGELVKRMRLREVLGNNQLAAKLTPSMPLVEQLLRDKANLSGVALANAKKLIRSFIDQVAAVLRNEVEKASAGEIDRSVPPKRVFQNLDLNRTIWKNLVNWSPQEERLYVDQLYYRRTARKKLPSTMIVVVDQSGSMVDAMVNCTILASIFAGLPKVDPHLLAYDTRAIDLSPYVNDPFEVLLRTNLGGGTQGMVAVPLVRDKITNPRKTVLVWISDFYDFNSTMLFNQLKSFKDSGVKVIPVGSVSSSGYQSVDPWFRKRFKELGCPVISGSIKKLIFELKKFLNT